MGVHNPMPSSLRNECRKAAGILQSFVDPRQAFAPDKIIPPSVLANAKGLAILTVAKVGFIATVRAGSGLIIARRPDGTWSAPSAIGTAGAGFGGQLGAELTDFVMILNDARAVKTFAQSGSITLGGNISVAAGPVGRNAEASGAASLRSVAGIFSYSKTKGLFAGVSLEGSVIIERKDANEKFYGRKISASQLLSGTVSPPMEADVLLSILQSRAFNPAGVDTMYNDRGDSGYGGDSFGAAGTMTRASRASTWGTGDRGVDRWDSTRRSRNSDDFDANPPSYGAVRKSSTYSDDLDKKTPPGRPTAPKPVFGKKRAESLGADQAIALFSFEATQDGDLGFKKGDIITITKRTDSKNDWWTGKIGERVGIFPSNYVETVR